MFIIFSEINLEDSKNITIVGRRPQNFPRVLYLCPHPKDENNQHTFWHLEIRFIAMLFKCCNFLSFVDYINLGVDDYGGF